MKILTISTWFPIPPNNGARIRTYHLQKSLCEHHTVDLLAITQNKSDIEHVDEVKRFCRRVATFPANKFRPESMDAWWKLFSPVPRCFESRYRPEMEALALRWMEEEEYDAVLAVTLGAAPYAIKLNPKLRILDQHNVECRILKRQWENESSPLRRMRYAFTWIKAECFERKLASNFDLIAVVSESERKIMQDVMGKTKSRIEVITNGIDPDLFGFPKPTKESQTIIFTGAMTYQPNYDAAQRLCGEVFPLIRKRYPEARLRITGKHEGIDISGMIHTPGVEFTGYMDDIRPMLASAQALVAPLHYGGGTRLKILEAMALGTPVVTTSMGAEGLDVTDDINILLGETSNELAAQTIRVLADPGLASRIADSAATLADEKYRWPSIAKSFAQKIYEVSADLGIENRNVMPELRAEQL